MATRKAPAKNLVIVESPAKAKTINKYLGSDFVVKASLGHVRDLPPREFGIDITDDFKPTYEVVRGRAKTVTELRKLADAADAVYLATDLDREGEAIAWHLVEALNLPNDKVRRVIFNAITKTAITEAFSSPHGIDLGRVNAQQARRILDRIVGYELSPLLWKKIAKGLSAGRVQSVAVRLIVDREREIRAFVPEESWKISAYFTGDQSTASEHRPTWREFISGAERTQKDIQRWLADHGGLRGELVELDGKPFGEMDVPTLRAVLDSLGFVVEDVQRRTWDAYKHLDLEQIEIVGKLGGPDGSRNTPTMRVADLATKRTTTKPPAPFTTATLQQQASTALRFSASRTMRTAQALYEGIDLNGDGSVGLITYMRTDSTHLSNEAVANARNYVEQHIGANYLPAEPNVYGKRQARAQEAHEAIRPTDATYTPERLRTALTEDQYKLYELIWKRFVACQMLPAQWDSTSVSITCDTQHGTARFAGSGRKLVFDGFMKVAGITSEDQILPHMETGHEVGLIDIEPKQHYTSPPPRYTEASLVKSLESEGIGRPSTYATIIDTIQSRGYVEQEDRKFYPTSLGELVTDKLLNHFPRIMDVKFTSHMEDELDKIEESNRDWVKVLHEFYDPFRELLSKAGQEMETVRSQPSEHACPDCNAPMVYRWSKAGRFLACSAYPGCKGTLNVDRHGNPIVPKQADVNCESCGKPMIIRQSRTGHFLGCTGYPDCRTTIPCNEDGEPLRLVSEDELKRPCDACGEGTLIVKRKGRRAFLGCDAYPKCKNTTPLPADVRLEKKPAPPPEEAGIACSKCGAAMVIRSGRRGKFVACSAFPKCRNTIAIDKLEDAKAKAAEQGAAPPPPLEASGNGHGGNGNFQPWQQGDPPPPGYALTRTGRPVVEDMPESGTLACPQCGGTVELKRGRFGPFFSCTAYPQCKFNCNLRGQAKKDADELMPPPNRPKPIPTDVPCDECGQPMIIREGRRGRFLGCSGYPKCKCTQELPPGFDVKKAAELAGVTT